MSGSTHTSKTTRISLFLHDRNFSFFLLVRNICITYQLPYIMLFALQWPDTHTHTHFARRPISGYSLKIMVNRNYTT